MREKCVKGKHKAREMFLHDSVAAFLMSSTS